MDKLELKKMLDMYDYNYYNKDLSLISDEEYDAIKKRYLHLCGTEEYDKVPGDVSDGMKRVKHSHPIMSLSKVPDEESLRKEIERLWPVVIQPKIDGLTVVGYPGTTTSKGYFLTRGDGEEGEDITHNAIKIEGINKVKKIDFTVRLEAYMPISVFNEINIRRINEGLKPFKNPRNAAAGMLRHKTAGKVEGVHYFAYNIVGSTFCNSDQVKILEANGFNAVDIYKPLTIDDAVDFVINFPFRDQLDYEIDGLVIKNDEYDSLGKFGSTGHHPKDSAAWKFKSKGAWTKLLNVDYQVGRTGRVTPMARIKPVEVGGSTISNATLHNNGIMGALSLTLGCDVYVIKSKDVIPAIIEARNSTENKISMVDSCPVCTAKLEEVNNQQFCRNVNCYAKLLHNICHIAKRDALDIEGLSEETARKIIDAEYIVHPFQIFDLNVEQLFELDGFAQKSADKLYQSIQRARRTSLKKFIYASLIPGVGRSVSEDIANTFGSLDAFLEDIKSGLVKTREIEGIGDILLNNILENYPLLELLAVKITPENAVLKSKPSGETLNFVITGTLEKPRNSYEELIKSKGHKLSSSVSSKTNYVVCDDVNFSSTKLDKARGLGVSIISCSEMEKLI